MRGYSAGPYEDLQHTFRTPDTDHFHQPQLVKAHERECFGNIASLGAVLRLSPIGRERRLCFFDNRAQLIQGRARECLARHRSEP
jgi:hypothetical protein